MRVVRSAGQNVSPSDDGRLFNNIFTDGLFNDTTINLVSGATISIGSMYGIMCGRDFTAEAQTIEATLPEDASSTTGYIYVEFDTTASPIISFNTALSPFTPTYEDINVNGAVCQMIIAEYTANSVAVSSVTPTYSKASAGVSAGSIATVEKSPAVANHDVGDFIIYNKEFYAVTAAITIGDPLTVGTNITLSSVGDELTSLNAGLSGLGQPVLIGTSATNPTSWTNFNLSESMANFNYLIIVLQRNAEQLLASVTVPIDDIVINYESWVAIYITSSWRCAMKYKKVSDTQMSAIIDERAGFSGYLNVYGVK